MGAKISALGLIVSFSPYLRSAMVRFPLMISGIVTLEVNIVATVYVKILLQ